MSYPDNQVTRIVKFCRARMGNELSPVALTKKQTKLDVMADFPAAGMVRAAGDAPEGRRKWFFSLFFTDLCRICPNFTRPDLQ